MMHGTVRVGLAILLALAGGLSGVGYATAATNEAPLADAGLDQQAGQNTTVYLDAGGSVDPDGSIVSYRWRIESPNGKTLRPACPTCAQTRFVPSEPGRYAVTVTVTDDDGATSSDTLYVDVSAVEGPSVSLDGPGEIPAGETENFEAHASAGDRPLRSITWTVDDRRADRQTVNGDDATVSHTVGFAGSGERTVTVLAVDAAGRTARDSTVVGVKSSSDGGGVSNAAVADTAIVFDDYILLDEGNLGQDGFGMNLGQGSKDTRIATEDMMMVLDETGVFLNNQEKGSYRISKDSQTGQRLMTVLEDSEAKGAGGYTRSNDDTMGFTDVPVPADNSENNQNNDGNDDRRSNSELKSEDSGSDGLAWTGNPPRRTKM